MFFYGEPTTVLQNNLILDNQQKIADFNNSGVTTFTGDVILQGDIGTIVEIPNLTIISGNLIISSSFVEQVILQNITSIQEAVLVQSADSLTLINLSGLNSIGTDLVVNNNGVLTTLDLSGLDSIGRDITVDTNSSLTTLDLSGLNLIGRDIIVDNNPLLTMISLPISASVGGDLLLTNNDSLMLVELPTSGSVGGDLTLTNNNLLTTLDLSGLNSIGGDILVTDNESLTTVNIPPSVVVAGSVQIDTKPILPPSGSNLLAWMDAADILAADGASVTSMPNKGTLGGLWNNTHPAGQTPPLSPLAATVDGKRALSFPAAWPSGTPHHGFSNSTFNFPSVTAASGVTLLIIAKQQQAWNPLNNPNFYLADVGYSSGMDSGLNIYTSLTSDTPFYTVQWKTIQPTQGGSTYTTNYKSAPQLPEEIVAYGTQLSTQITNNQSFFQIRQNNNSDFFSTAAASSTGIVGTIAGPIRIGGTAVNESNYNFSGLIYEVLVWNTLVSQNDIKAYLNQKYGGTW